MGTAESLETVPMIALIGLLMDTLDGATRGIVHPLKGGIPLEGDGGGTSHAGLAGNAEGC